MLNGGLFNEKCFCIFGDPFVRRDGEDACRSRECASAVTYIVLEDKCCKPTSLCSRPPLDGTKGSQMSITGCEESPALVPQPKATETTEQASKTQSGHLSTTISLFFSFSESTPPSLSLLPSHSLSLFFIKALRPPGRL